MSPAGLRTLVIVCALGLLIWAVLITVVLAVEHLTH